LQPHLKLPEITRCRGDAAGLAGWLTADRSRRFFDPINLTDGCQLMTLPEAANYITALPASERDLPHWRAAVQALLLCVDHGEPGADPLLARIGMMQALNAGKSIERSHEGSAPG
jgi:hypothetical protein